MVMNVVAKTLVRSRIWTVLVSYHVRTCGEVADSETVPYRRLMCSKKPIAVIIVISTT